VRLPTRGISAFLAAVLAAGCAGGARARGSVQTDIPQHDEFFRRAQTLLARVELAEEATRAPELVAPPPGMQVRITGEGPEALAEVTGAPDAETHLRALLAAEHLATAPPLLDAVPSQVEAMLAESPTLLREAMFVPGTKGGRLRSAHMEAARRLKELPERARAAAGAARQLLRRLGEG
jgi:hypothetical protein